MGRKWLFIFWHSIVFEWNTAFSAKTAPFLKRSLFKLVTIRPTFFLFLDPFQIKDFVHLFEQSFHSWDHILLTLFCTNASGGTLGVDCCLVFGVLYWINNSTPDISYRKNSSALQLNNAKHNFQVWNYLYNKDKNHLSDFKLY